MPKRKPVKTSKKTVTRKRKTSAPAKKTLKRSVRPQKASKRPVKSKRAKLFRLKFSKPQALVIALVFAVIGGYYITHSHATTVVLNGKPVGIQSGAPDGSGYWVVGADGGIFTQGAAHFYGSRGSSGAPYNFVGMAVTGSNSFNGYWLVDALGQVYAYGAAHYEGGSPPNTSDIVGMAANASNNGYWLVGKNGSVYSYGAVHYYGGVTGHDNIVGIASLPDGDGYWIVDSNGDIFSFGSIHYYGGTPANNAGNIVGMAVTPDGGGYWLAGANGGVFTYGDAKYYGSMGGKPLNKPIDSISATSDGKGYWLLGADGGVFAFGDADYQGGVTYNPTAPNLSVNNPVINGKTVTVSGSYTFTQPGATLKTFSINWGDGSTSSSFTSHTYASYGTSYKITVTIVDSNNLSASKQFNITTGAAPVVKSNPGTSGSSNPGGGGGGGGGGSGGGGGGGGGGGAATSTWTPSQIAEIKTNISKYNTALSQANSNIVSSLEAQIISEQNLYKTDYNKYTVCSTDINNPTDQPYANDGFPLCTDVSQENQDKLVYEADAAKLAQLKVQLSSIENTATADFSALPSVIQNYYSECVSNSRNYRTCSAVVSQIGPGLLNTYGL